VKLTLGAVLMRHIFVVLLTLFVSACNPPLTVSQQVIAVIREMETRMENGERRQFIKHVAEDFSGQNGQLNRQELQRLVIFQFNRHQRLNAQLFPITVTETGENSATARFKALITGGPGWIPDQGQLYDFETHWRFESGDWILASADWTPVL
jgi:hypothetical protein